MLVILCLFLTPAITTFSKMPNGIVKHIESLNITMVGDLLIATSNNPNDPLVKVEVFNGAGQKVAQTGCSGTKCTLDLSSLAPGTYLAKATSLTGFLNQNIQVY